MVLITLPGTKRLHCLVQKYYFLHFCILHSNFVLTSLCPFGHHLAVTFLVIDHTAWCIPELFCIGQQAIVILPSWPSPTPQLPKHQSRSSASHPHTNGHYIPPWPNAGVPLLPVPRVVTASFTTLFQDPTAYPYITGRDYAALSTPTVFWTWPPKFRQ